MRRQKRISCYLPSVCRSGRWRSCQVQRSLNAAFQDLLRLGSVGHGPCELERAHHEAEDGRRAAACRYGIGVRKQSGQRRHVASQPFCVVLPGGQGLAGDFREQRRRGAPACRVFKVSAVQVPPDRALEVQTSQRASRRSRSRAAIASRWRWLAQARPCIRTA
jgi:hypothetical protein